MYNIALNVLTTQGAALTSNTLYLLALSIKFCVVNEARQSNHKKYPAFEVDKKFSDPKICDLIFLIQMDVMSCL